MFFYNADDHRHMLCFSTIYAPIYNQYYVMNYSINSFTGASEANLLVQGIFCVSETKHFGDMVHGTESVCFDPIS